MHLSLFGLRAAVCEASAEALPFPDDTFDLVAASGVLHHTPQVETALREACRVTAPNGQGKITLYRKGILHTRLVFVFVPLVMRFLGLRHPGSDLGSSTSGVDDFIRRYDGDENPLGIGKTGADWAADLRAAGWTVDGWGVHFFPKRFLPFARWVPGWVHRCLDGAFGTMAYFHLRKPG
jgi:SAM-dependent methyltransferase